MSAAFLVTSLVIVITPGTGALFTISTGVARGWRAALVAAAGCTLGIVPHLAAAVTGTAALLHAGGVAFEVVRWAGVVYLLWMAVATWRDRSSLHPAPGATAPSAARVVAKAVAVNLLNPKLTIFFAFLPQFAPLPSGAGSSRGASGASPTPRSAPAAPPASTATLRSTAPPARCRTRPGDASA